jgi:hypothetical protein
MENTTVTKQRKHQNLNKDLYAEHLSGVAPECAVPACVANTTVTKTKKASKHEKTF